MDDVRRLKDSEIEEQLNALKAERDRRRLAARKARSQQNDALSTYLRDNQALVDALCPAHDRTSCSDSNLRNGEFNGCVDVRCTRCALLRVSSGETLPDDYRLDVQLQRVPIGTNNGRSA